MAEPCPTPITGTGFLGTTLSHLDCQAETIGAEGYHALAASGSPITLALTTILTLYIAIWGFRMLRGALPSFSELTIAALKVGFVLALATSWSTSRATVYDAILRSPAEISGSIGAVAGLPGTQGGLVQRVQAADDAITGLIAAGSGRLELSSVQANDPRARNAPPLFSDDFALGLGRTFFVSALIAGIGLLRLMGGVLLALVPLFAGLLLFDAMRWLFMGWLRSMIAIWIGSLVVAIVVGVELALLEPWLSNVLALRAALRPTIEAPFELVTLTLSFAVILFGSLMAVTWLSFSTSVSVWMRQRLEQVQQGAHLLMNQSDSVSHTQTERSKITEPPERATLIAQSVMTAERRDSAARLQLVEQGSVMMDRRTPVAASNNNLDGVALTPVPLGQSYKRASQRVSGAVARRNASS